jgi:hypothetical protein
MIPCYIWRAILTASGERIFFLCQMWTKTAAFFLVYYPSFCSLVQAENVYDDLPKAV